MGCLLVSSSFPNRGKDLDVLVELALSDRFFICEASLLVRWSFRSASARKGLWNRWSGYPFETTFGS